MSGSFAFFATVAMVTIYTGPKPEITATFKDWTTGCDNSRNCAAIALGPVADDIDGPIDHLEVQIEQASAHHLDPVVSIKLPAGEAGTTPLKVWVDGTMIELPALTNGRFIFTGTLARGLLQKLRKGSQLTLRHDSGATISRASLLGLTAALLRIDEQQGKVGTPRALVRQGQQVSPDDLPGYSVSISRARHSEIAPAAPDALAMAGLYTNDRCGNERSTPPQMARLDADNTMMIAAWRCGSGAYNLYSNIIIVGNDGTIRPARFDYDNRVTSDGPSNVLVNVVWNDGKRVIESFIKHRAIGDCGRVDRYIWGGEKFMLSEQFVMPECRMAFDRIRTWRVDVADR